MELSSTRIIPAPRDRVWQALNDPETLKASVPGCESLERIDADSFRAAVATKIGPVSAKFAGTLHLLDIDAGNGYRLKFEGQGGAAGFANGEARVALSDAPDHQTSLSYTVKATVGGKLAQIGSRLVDSAAKKLADDFFARFASELAQAPAAEIATQAPAVTPTAPRGGSRWVRVLAIGVILAIVIYLYARGAP
jgi:carbon monoxide dehydrogenase subunit G